MAGALEGCGARTALSRCRQRGSGQNGNFTLRGSGRPEINDLRPTFVRAYDTFTGTDASARSTLSAQVLRLFGATESAQEKVAPLLAAIDQ